MSSFRPPPFRSRLVARLPSNRREVFREGRAPLLEDKVPFYERYPSLTGWLVCGAIVIAIIMAIAAYE